MGRPLSVRVAVERDLAGLPPELSRSALAVSALVLARRLDDPRSAATAVPALARELREALGLLRGQASGGVPDRMSAFEESLRS